MINDVLHIDKLQNQINVPVHNAINTDSFDEFWSFWGVEQDSYPKINGKFRLRYHLGHSLVIERLNDLHKSNHKVVAIICDFERLHNKENEDYNKSIETTRSFLESLLDQNIEIKYISQMIETVRDQHMEYYRKIQGKTIKLAKPIINAYENIIKSSENSYYLEKYRDLSVPDLLYIPQGLASYYRDFSNKSPVDPYIFFAALYALEQSEKRAERDFIRNFWVEEGFPFFASLHLQINVKPNRICIIEGRRSAYIWTFLEFLRIMIKRESGEISWPTLAFLDSLPAANGSSFMQLEHSSGAIFIDSDEKEIREILLKMPDSVRREYCIRYLNQPLHSLVDKTSWDESFLLNISVSKNRLSKILYPKLPIWLTIKITCNAIDEVLYNIPSALWKIIKLWKEPWKRLWKKWKKK